MRLTKRDICIIEKVKEFKVLSSSQIQRLFNMNQSTCSKRMSFIVDNIKDIKKIGYVPTYNFYDEKYKGILRNENIYYYKRKGKSITHDLLVNEFYIRLLELSNEENFNIIEFTKEYPITVDDEFVVRADAKIILEYDNQEFGTKVPTTYEYLLEVENNKSFNGNKYKMLKEQGWLPLPVICMSDRRVYNKDKSIELIKLRLNLSDINKLILDMKSLEKEYKYKVNF